MPTFYPSVNASVPISKRLSNSKSDLFAFRVGKIDATANIVF